MPALIDPERFRRAYQQSVRDVMGFVTAGAQELIARHDLSLHPDRHDLGIYLLASERRCLEAVRLCNAHCVVEPGQLRALEVGGFLGAYPLTLARLGVPVTLVEAYAYYYGAFDDLASYLTSQGVAIWDADFTVPLEQPPELTYTLITNMAMLEHLASSPRALMDNLRRSIDPRGLLIVELPNVAYWPNRLEALRGQSIHQPLDLVYASAVPYVGHHREYTVHELSELLRWSGFREREVRLFNYSLSLRRGTWFDRLYTLCIYLWPTILFRDCRELIMAAATPIDPAEPPEAVKLLRDAPA